MTQDSNLQQERDALHKALRECLTSLGNGSFASESSSVEFVLGTPREVALEVDHLRRVANHGKKLCDSLVTQANTLKEKLNARQKLDAEISAELEKLCLLLENRPQ